MKLLCICEPSRYNGPSLEIPLFYQSVARDRRVDFFHTSVENLFNQNRDRILAIPVVENFDYQDFWSLNSQSASEYLIEDFDLVFCRTLKPFPPGYLDKLCTWKKMARFVNNPTGIKQQIKPTFFLESAGNFIPPMIVTNKLQEAKYFFDTYQTIVAKKSNSCGGKGVFKVCYQSGKFQVDNFIMGTHNFDSLAEVMNYIQGENKEPIQLVKYLDQVKAGDKRILVVDGEIYGAHLRRSKNGYWVNNMSVDGECFLAEVSDAEHQAIQSTVESYRQLGLYILGYDFLLDESGTWCISEINAGNVGGFARQEVLSGEPIMDQFITWLINFADSH